MVFFTSDLHLFHRKDFLYIPRGFASPEEHALAIMMNWNAAVGMEDDVYVLGDLMLNDNAAGLAVLKQLKGKIHIIRGNHDSDARIELYKQCWNVVEVVDAKYLKLEGYHFFLSHYPCLCDNYDSDKPLRSRQINLCGHRHTQDKWADWDKGLIYHVELDAHNNTPISIVDIIGDIKER